MYRWRIAPRLLRGLLAQASQSKTRIPDFTTISPVRHIALSGVLRKSDLEAENTTGNSDNLTGLLDNIHPGLSKHRVPQIMDRLSTSVNQEELVPLVKKALEIHEDMVKQGKDEPTFEDNEADQTKKLVELLIILSDGKFTNVDTRGIISCLKSASAWGLTSHNSFAVRNLENCLTWKARSASINDLTYLISFAHKRKNVDNVHRLTEAMFNAVVGTIERRWIEIEEPKAILGFMNYCPEVFGNQFMGRLEDRILEMAESMSGEEQVKVSQH